MRHEVNEWTDRTGETIGATVFLSKEELEELKETGSVTISKE